MSKTVTLDIDHAPLLNRLIEVLESEPSTVRQQQAIELLTVRFALRASDKGTAIFIADGIAKHVIQMIRQYPKG